MSEQTTTAAGTDVDAQRSIDRRKFLLGTTAVTAGVWAAPSVLTIDRAFGTTGSPCPACSGTDAATVKGTALTAFPIPGLPLPAPIAVRQNACLNDDDLETTVPLPQGLGFVTLAGASCGGCVAKVNTADVLLNLPGAPITAQALQSEAFCVCEADGNKPQGKSRVAGLTVAGQPVADTTEFREIPLPGGGFVRLNESPATGADAGEFNALHVVVPGVLDLKLASSKIAC